MAVLNKRSVLDTRKVMSGKDGMLFDQDGNHMATAENFQSQVAISGTNYQPLGDMQEHTVPISYRVTLTFGEIIVHDSKFFIDIMNGMKNHRMPIYNFRGVMQSPYDNSQEEIVYRDCVPDGTIDIQNMAVGELYKRAWSFVVNQPPDMQSMLKN